MGIIYCEKDRTFTLQTKETTYQMQVCLLYTSPSPRDS